MPERDVLEPDGRVAANDPGEPADPLRDDRVPLVRHRGRALLPGAERLFDLPHLRARQVPDLQCEAFERGGEQCQCRQKLRVPIALQDLRRARRGLEPESFARDPLHLGGRRCVRADCPRELAHSHALERLDDPRAVTVELKGPSRELEPERGRLGVHPVRPPDRRRVAMLLGARDDGRECLLEPGQHEPARVLHGQSERGVEHVGRGEPEVEPASLLAELLCDRVDERGDVVMRRAFELGDPLRCWNPGSGAYPLGRRPRNTAHLAPRVERRQLHGEPPLELCLLRPHVRHRRSGVARDHYARF